MERPTESRAGRGKKQSQIAEFTHSKSKRPEREAPAVAGLASAGAAAPSAHAAMSANTLTEIILSGSLTGSPRLILSTFSMPSTTAPHTVY